MIADETPPDEAGSDDEVTVLWRRWRDDHDGHAREKLIVHYSPLVKFVAGRVGATLPGSVDRADVLEDGLVGLIDAVDKFDPDRGVLFQTYALTRIRGAIVDALRASDWLPRGARERVRAQETAEATLVQRLQRKPSAQELAEELGSTAQAVLHTWQDRDRARVRQLELDDTASIQFSTRGLAEPGEGELPPHVVSAVRSLTERHQVVIALYYWERLTLAEIGRVLGVGESRVSQLHHAATDALRAALSSD